jgi:hypothetical protein
VEDAMKARCLVVAMVLTATAVTGAKEPLSIRVSPAFSCALANLVIRTSVEPDAENRSMEVDRRLGHLLPFEQDYARRRLRAQDDDGRISQRSTW